MKCEVCNETELEGGLPAEETDSDEEIVSDLVAPGPRNWIQCDSCGRLVCDICCTHPRRGYCDSCINKDSLYADTVEVGMIKE